MWNYITIDKDFNEVKRKNFFLYLFTSSFVWMCFHFTLVFFFLIQLWSPLLVWFFLWIWNLVAFLSDSPIWVFQKYFSAKKIFLFSWYLMLIVSIIFLYFIYQTNTINITNIEIDFSVEALKNLFSSFFNIFLLLLAVTFYWIIKELSDVTSLSYIMNNSDPSEYSSLFSKRNIYSWQWSLAWLVIIWIILALNTLVAVFILVILIIIFLISIEKYFDRDDNEIKLSDIKKIKLITKENIIKSKDNLIKSVSSYTSNIIENKSELIEKTKNIKVIFLKPIEVKNKIDFKDVYETTKIDLNNFFEILFSKPYNYKLLIMWLIFTLFWFWDTFVASFLIDFLDQVLRNNMADLAAFKLQNILTAYVFIALLAIPAYSMQLPLIKLWEKIWIIKIILFWILISWISIISFSFSELFIFILIAWLINSIWYAAWMPTSQWEFSIEYNNTYSKKKNLKEIDANASSAPIKMLANLANVLWLFMWWLLIQFFWYSGTFIVFWWIMISIFILTLIKKEKYNLK